MKIVEALKLLDPNEDGHWTSDGSPRVDIVSELVGSPLKRGDIRAADAQFNRDVARAFKEGAPTPSEKEAAASSDAINKAEPSIRRQEADKKIVEKKAQDAEAERIAKIDAIVEQIAELQPDHDEAKAEVEAAKEKYDKINRKINELNIKLEALESLDRRRLDRSIRSYIEASKAERAQRAGRANEFLKSISPGQLRDMIQPGSRLDQAMKARKAGRGAVRPKYPMKE